MAKKSGGKAFEAKDKASDRRKGIPENSARDKKLDSKAGGKMPKRSGRGK